MNVKKPTQKSYPERSKAVKKSVISTLLVLGLAQTIFAESAQTIVRQANKRYANRNFNEAINKYDQALLDQPNSQEPKFNKANSYYRLDDLVKAKELYKEVAVDSKDMKLVAKAKYNLGNSYFQQGLKQRDSDLQKALDDLKTSIVYWRQVLDIEPENEKSAKNIEVARLIIKDIIDQLNKQKQQQDPNQPQDPNQGKGQQQHKGLPQDSNQPQDPNQPQQQQQAKESFEEDPNQPQQQQTQQQKQDTDAPDATAQEILDKEQRQRKERQMLQRARYQKVEKDW